jgi:bile acid:Na+ symporter, BASS family
MPPVLDLILTGSLALIMFSLGLSLTMQDFAQVIKDRRAFVIGCVGQLLMLPLIAAAIIFLFEPSPAIAVGLLILAVAPGGATSAFMTSLLKGNLALSVSLTAVCSLLCVLTTPFLLSMLIPVATGGAISIAIPVQQIVQSMMIVVVGPVAAGMLLRAILPELARQIKKPIKILAVVLFAALLVGAIVSQIDLVREHFAAAGLFTIILNVSTILGALALSLVSRVSARDGIAIIFECGLQNAPLAMFIAISVLGQPELSIAAAIYGVLQAPVTLLLGYLIYRAGYNRPGPTSA